MIPPPRPRRPRPATPPGCQVDCGLWSGGAFTLLELLLVIAIIAILAALMMPGLAGAKAKAQRATCLNNLKQDALAFQMYSADNDGKLAPNYPLDRANTNSWVLGDMRLSADSTNAAFIREGKLFPYASQVALYHCPADPSRTGATPRARSYAMNGWVGSRYMETYPRKSEFRTFVRDGELAAAGPARIWVIADEHEGSIDDAWFLVTMDDSRPFASFPATRHDRSYGLDFADGHTEFIKLRDAKAVGAGTQVNAGNPDWQRLKQVTTIR